MSRCACKGRDQGRHDLALLEDQGRLVTGSVTRNEITEGGTVRENDKKRADATNQARIAKIGTDLMNAYNRGQTDPSKMATHGHDSMTGFEFFIEEDGFVTKVALSRDLDT